MPSSEPQVVLHHYIVSPYAWKIRAALALKNIPYLSYVVPPIPPRAVTQGLTGGYRRIPVLQIGSDLYCDTYLILKELERRYPTPSLHESALSDAISQWTDGSFFSHTSALMPWEALPNEFREDRARMMSIDIDPKKIQKFKPWLRDRARLHFDIIEKHFKENGKRQWYLDTPEPSMADIHVAMNVFFVINSMKEEVRVWLTRDKYPNVHAYYERLKARIGKGEFSQIDDEKSLEIARTNPISTDADKGKSEGGDLIRVRLGDVVSVTPTDYGKVAVLGKVVSLTEDAIGIERKDDKFGIRTVVHFPKRGYSILPSMAAKL